MSDHIQPMPELTPDELDTLRGDIAANGVLVPVVKDQHGRILDGNHRAAIAAELGIDYPVVTVEVADDAEAWSRAVALNCARRHLNREQRREIIAAEIRRRPGDSDRAIARRVGCSPTTVGTVRSDLRIEAGELTEADAVRLTEQVRGYVEQWRDQIAMHATISHRRLGVSWARVADILENGEREAQRENMSKLDTPPTDDEYDEIFDGLFGPMFAEMRAYRCESPHCEHCEPVSKLDSAAATEAVVR